MNVYQVLRKSGRYSWHPCILRENGRLIRGGRTPNLDVAYKNLEKLEADFPNEQYAVITIVVKEKK